ncbi:AbrB/MazE/SpoVT family DNA-binding domain-containing protein [Candidatus Daviesbacteria bacterium]|nr:AbrB/MazE/SpoVT family DNA-binding domain-containing protein [Candidatus Daviesbacteria bacterium]
MNYIATITSKRQLTLPSKLTHKLNLKPGEKIAIKEENGRLVMTPAVRLVEELAGSLKLPNKFKGLDTKQMIEKAKKEYFSR